MKSGATWVIGVLAVSLFVYLGFWQLSRADERKAIYDQYQAQLASPPVQFDTVINDLSSPQLYRGVSSDLSFIEASSRFIVNRPIEGRNGVHHVVLARHGGAVLMVDLGWLPADAQGNLVTPINVPALISGNFRLYPAPSKPTWGSDNLESMFATLQWPWINADVWQTQTRQPITTKWLLVLESSNQALPHRFHPPQIQDKSATNIGYAGQWFLFALVLVGFMIYFAVKKARGSLDAKRTATAT